MFKKILSDTNTERLNRISPHCHSFLDLSCALRCEVWKRFTSNYFNDVDYQESETHPKKIVILSFVAN